MADHINLNEEISHKQYSSYSNAKIGELNTLQEPVTETIVHNAVIQKRDLSIIGQKIKTTLSGEGDYNKLQK